MPNIDDCLECLLLNSPELRGSCAKVEARRPAHARSGPAAKSLLTSSSIVLAAFFALALLYGYDGYFFESYYGSATWKLFQQIGGTFAF